MQLNSYLKYIPQKQVHKIHYNAPLSYFIFHPKQGLSNIEHFIGPYYLVYSMDYEVARLQTSTGQEEYMEFIRNYGALWGLRYLIR